MPVAAVILVEPSGAANVGAVLRVAANFSVPLVHLVRPVVDPTHPDIAAWACGAEQFVDIRRDASFEDSAGGYHLVAATVSGRGRSRLPVVDPAELRALVAERGADATALVFGNETSGLPRRLLDRADIAVRIPTRAEFPVLNLAQAVGILLAGLAMDATAARTRTSDLASQQEIQQLMSHLRTALLEIGFLDPESPERILRKLRGVFGRAGLTTNELAILRGVCRQMIWARRQPSARWTSDESG